MLKFNWLFAFGVLVVSVFASGFTEPETTGTGQNNFLEALLYDYTKVLGEPNAYRQAVAGTPACLTACKKHQQPAVTIDGAPSSSDLLRILMNTKFGFVNDANNRWNALRRVDNVISSVGLENISLDEKDIVYLAGDFRVKLNEARIASDIEFKHIDLLIGKAVGTKFVSDYFSPRRYAAAQERIMADSTIDRVGHKYAENESPVLEWANDDDLTESALNSLQEQAEHGDAIAQINLGQMYAIGEGVPENGAEAAKWYRLAADQGFATAQFQLGAIFATGKGVSKDTAEAIKWLRLAAEQEHASAQYVLGLMYYSGKGVPQNYVKSYLWFSVAAAQEHKAANERREVVEKRMTPEQIAEAQALAARCFESNYKDCD